MSDSRQSLLPSDDDGTAPLRRNNILRLPRDYRQDEHGNGVCVDIVQSGTTPTADENASSTWRSRLAPSAASRSGRFLRSARHSVLSRVSTLLEQARPTALATANFTTLLQLHAHARGSGKRLPDFAPTTGVRGLAALIILVGRFFQNFAPRSLRHYDSSASTTGSGTSALAVDSMDPPYPLVKLPFTQPVTVLFLLSGMLFGYLYHESFDSGNTTADSNNTTALAGEGGAADTDHPPASRPAPTAAPGDTSEGSETPDEISAADGPRKEVVVVPISETPSSANSTAESRLRDDDTAQTSPSAAPSAAVCPFTGETQHSEGDDVLPAENGSTESDVCTRAGRGGGSLGGSRSHHSSRSVGKAGTGGTSPAVVSFVTSGSADSEENLMRLGESAGASGGILISASVSASSTGSSTAEAAIPEEPDKSHCADHSAPAPPGSAPAAPCSRPSPSRKLFYRRFMVKRVAKLMPFFYAALFLSAPFFFGARESVFPTATKVTSGLLTPLMLNSLFVTQGNAWEIVEWQVSCYVLCYACVPLLFRVIKPAFDSAFESVGGRGDPRVRSTPRSWTGSWSTPRRGQEAGALRASAPRRSGRARLYATCLTCYLVPLACFLGLPRGHVPDQSWAHTFFPIRLFHFALGMTTGVALKRRVDSVHSNDDRNYYGSTNAHRRVVDALTCLYIGYLLACVFVVKRTAQDFALEFFLVPVYCYWLYQMVWIRAGALPVQSGVVAARAPRGPLLLVDGSASDSSCGEAPAAGSGGQDPGEPVSSPGRPPTLDPQGSVLSSGADSEAPQNSRSGTPEACASVRVTGARFRKYVRANQYSITLCLLNSPVLQLLGLYSYGLFALQCPLLYWACALRGRGEGRFPPERATWLKLGEDVFFLLDPLDMLWFVVFLVGVVHLFRHYVDERMRMWIEHRMLSV